MAKIAIIGPGAIGGVIAAWLDRTGIHEVTLCARRPLEELQVETPSGLLSFRPRVLIDPAEATAMDFVVVATKAYDAEATGNWLAGLATRDTHVAILQNGVEHRERFAPYLRPTQILPAVVRLSAERPELTRIRQRSAAKLVVPAGNPGEEFAALFAGTLVEVVLTHDFKSAAWYKLCGNAPGVINTLLRQATGALRDEAIGNLVLEIVRECVTVGRAEGAVLEDSVPETVLQALRGIPPDSVNSMQADREAGRPLELDSRNGVIVRRGQIHGIPTPFNQMAITLLEAMLRLESRR